MDNKEWDQNNQQHGGANNNLYGQSEENPQLTGQYQDKYNPDANEVIVKGLSFKAEGDDVRQFFSQYGEIQTVNIERRFNGDSKGSCFIKFASSEGMNKALEANGVEFLGRQVWVARTRPKSERMKEFGPRRANFRGNNYYSYRGGNNNYQGQYHNDGGHSAYNGGGYGNFNGGYGGYVQGQYMNNNFNGGYNDFDGGYIRRGAGRGRGYTNHTGFNGIFRGNRFGNRRGQYEGQKRPQKVEESNIIFVGNMNYRTEMEEIWSFFNDVGKVVDVRIAKNQTGSKKGFAHIEFETQEDAQAALSMNGKELGGRELRVDLAAASKTD